MTTSSRTDLIKKLSYTIDLAKIKKLSNTIDLANELMKQYGFLDRGWKFEFNTSIRACGLCDYRERKIILSRHYVEMNQMELIRNTILHELAHALCPGEGHNKKWKMMCVKIGCKPERLNSEAKMPSREPLWEGICGGCKARFTWNRKPTRKMMGCHCRKCGPINGRIVITAIDSDGESAA